MPKPHRQSQQQIAQTARRALHLLTQRGLPPSPENYAAVYQEISGEALPFADSGSKPVAAEQKLDNDRELISWVLSLISAVSDQTTRLADDLGERNKSIASSVKALEQTEEKQEILGLLQIISATAHAIQNSVEHTSRELIDTKTALEEMRTELQQTRTQLMLDPLTGTRNRFGMDITLNQEIARARRSESHLTAALVDLDFFKDINDRHGHEAGDQMLLHFTQLSRAVLRESDLLFRYGGEEFLVVLPDTEQEGAIFVLQRLQQMLSKSPLRYAQTVIKATFSAGVAGLLAGDNAASLVQRADQALYRAKEGGRNRVEIAAPPSADTP